MECKEKFDFLKAARTSILLFITLEDLEIIIQNLLDHQKQNLDLSLIPEFKHYKVEKGPKYSIEDVSNFDIANKAVSDARKKIKNVINILAMKEKLLLKYCVYSMDE